MIGETWGWGPSLLLKVKVTFGGCAKTNLRRYKYYEAGGHCSTVDGLPHIATSVDGRRLVLQGVQVDRVMKGGLCSWKWFGGVLELRDAVRYATDGLR